MRCPFRARRRGKAARLGTAAIRITYPTTQRAGADNCEEAMSETAIRYLMIGLGSALGGMARYWCNGAMARLLGETFPWGTLAVNAVGCGAIGWFAGATAPEGRWFVPSLARQFVMVG